MATLEVFTARQPPHWRREWRVAIALVGDPRTTGLVIGTGLTKQAALFAALTTLDLFTDLVMHTADPAFAQPQDAAS